ncbi:hypothetical protein BDY19DRAFT_978467 [Irpex rosettiformis]|uniref:Uncharacterized protein n=1 Tax=Irpex rosettiformis TaxID=378272 RepID=A0ACB8TN78_9APHY|nr:hypothetical protein BDY19DRAFT_978467 [Irpex rosettiformis]
MSFLLIVKGWCARRGLVSLLVLFLLVLLRLLISTLLPLTPLVPLRENPLECGLHPETGGYGLENGIGRISVRCRVDCALCGLGDGLFAVGFVGYRLSLERFSMACIS